MAVMTAYRTSVGKKVLMAVTGLIWIGFLFFHMYGNTKAFKGAEYFNHYAEALRDFGAPVLGHMHFLIIMRTVVTIALLVHAYYGITLWLRNRASRGATGYNLHRKVEADLAGKTMRYGGVAIALFVIYHLMQFTWGVKATLPTFERGAAYENMVAGFMNPVNVIIYLAALVFLGLHLYHGAWSMFQTLGLNNRDTRRWIHGFALVLAIVVAGGFALVPLAVTFGILTLPA